MTPKDDLLSKEIYAMADETQGVAPASNPTEAPTAAAIVARPFPAKPQAAVGMPRRFSIGTMMILTTLFAVLFGILKALQAPAAIFAAISLFAVGVVASQALLFKGKLPRLASFVGGMVMFFSIGTVMVVLALLDSLSPLGFSSFVDMLGAIVGVAIAAVFLGGPLGYGIGCVAAAIFLVRKEPNDGEPMPDEPSADQTGEEENGQSSVNEAGRLPGSSAAGRVMGSVAEASQPERRPSQSPVDAAGSHDAGYVLAALVDEAMSAGRLPELPVVEKGPWGAPFGLKPSQPAVCVPRRFSVGTMMILVTACAVLLGTLKSFGVPPDIFAAVAAFIGGVGVCQVLLFKGTDPRRASFFGGMITSGILTTIAAPVAWFMTKDIGAVVGCVFGGSVLSVIAGGPLGYAAGCLVAAIFLVRKEPDETDPPEEPAEHGP